MRKLTIQDVAGEENFIHFDPVHGQRIFAVQRLLAAIRAEQVPPVMVAVDPEFAQWMRANNRGIEQHRLDRLTHAIVDAADPILLLVQEDGQMLLVDGSHRFVWLAEQGVPEARAWIMPPDVWQQFVVDGELAGLTEEALQRLPSGL